MQPTLFDMDPAPARATAGSSASVISRRELNPAQYEAATTVAGPVLVIAGAGSGKTRTLVYRMAHLLSQGVAPEEILLLTFTRKAAQEMLHRASALVDDSCQRVMGGTFHAVANLLLRRYGRHIGFAPNFTIIDRADAEGIVNLIKSSLNLGVGDRRFPSKRVVVNLLSKAVNKSVPLGALLDDEFGHLAEYLDDLIRIRDHYHQFKVEHGLMDYDDLLVNWQRVLDFGEVREEVSRRFRYLMVDEYQDTNRIQAAIVRAIAHSHDNVMVVGDDSQSIYSFRGADFRNIMEFPTLFPGTRMIRLEENYRSCQPILTMTNAVIERAAERYTKSLFSRIEGGERPALVATHSEGDQARFVADRILALRRDGVPLREMAVLFRSGYHSYKLELELANRQLPFEKRGGLKLTESAHIKDVLAFLRVTCNPGDHLSWNRLLLLLDKVGPKTVQKILDRIKGAEDPLAALAAYPAAPSWRAGLAELAELLAGLLEPGLAPVEQFDRVMDHYRPVFERVYHDDYPRRSRDLEQLRAIVEGYADLQGLIDDTALDPPEAGTEAEDGAGDRLVLSTVHSAKGLEWDAVFIIHLVEGKFPSAQAALPEQLEEERRLLYVAATRARKHLFLVYPRQVAAPDRSLSYGTVSPFLAELPPGLMRSESAGVAVAAPFAAPSAVAVSPATARAPRPAPAVLPAVGAAVRHPFFGDGTVAAVVGPRTLEVNFSRHGRKTLHLDYAKLEVVG